MLLLYTILFVIMVVRGTRAPYRSLKRKLIEAASSVSVFCGNICLYVSVYVQVQC